MITQLYIKEALVISQQLRKKAFINNNENEIIRIMK